MRMDLIENKNITRSRGDMRARRRAPSGGGKNEVDAPQQIAESRVALQRRRTRMTVDPRHAMIAKPDGRGEPLESGIRFAEQRVDVSRPSGACLGTLGTPLHLVDNGIGSGTVSRQLVSPIP